MFFAKIGIKSCKTLFIQDNIKRIRRQTGQIPKTGKDLIEEFIE